MLRHVSCLIPLLMIAAPAVSQPAKGVRPPPDVPFKVEPPSIETPAVPQSPPAIHLPPLVPPALKLLTQRAVQAEVDLTPRQKEMVIVLSDAWEISPRAWEPGTMFLITPEMGRVAVMRKTKEFLDTGLLKVQRTRLDQIVFQLREREFGAYAAFAMAARDLGLRPEQLEDVSNLKGVRVDEIAKHVVSGDRFDKIKDRVSATNGETFEKMTEMLTKSQRERLKEMRGRVFNLPAEVGRPLTGDRPPEAKSAYPAELFGSFDFEIRYLQSTAVSRELSLTDDQARIVKREIEQWDVAFFSVPGRDIEKVPALHDRTEKALKEILTAKQRTRFDEIMTRRRLTVGGWEAACGYPPVVAALKLTPLELRAFKEGKLVADVLGKVQIDSLDRFVGEAFDPTGLAVSDPVVVRFEEAKRQNEARAKQDNRPSSHARSFLVISNRLRLSEKQIARLRELADDEPKIMELIQKELDFADTPPVIGAGRSLTSANAVTGLFKTAIEEQCWSVLDAQQQSAARRFFGVRR